MKGVSKIGVADFAYYGLIFSIYVSINSITAQLFGVQQVGSPLILIFCTIILATHKIEKASFQKTPIILLYLVFLSYYAIGFLTRLYYIDVGYRVELLTQIMQFVTTMIIIVTLHQYYYQRLYKDEREVLVFNAVLIAVLIAGGYSVYQSLSGALVSEEGYINRASGVFGNANGLGIQGNIGLLLSFYTLLAHKRFFILKIGLIPFFMYVTFLSLSRAALITSILIIGFTLLWLFINFLRAPKFAVRRATIIGTLPSLFAIYLIFNFESFLLNYLDYGQAKRMISLAEILTQGKINNNTTSGRVEVFEFGFKQILNRPFFGNGLGYFQYFPEELNFKHGVHNTYLLIFGDSGIFAFAFFIFFIVYMCVASLFSKVLVAQFTIGAMILWSMQCLGSHNGLDEKMFVILVTMAASYLVFGSKKAISN